MKDFKLRLPSNKNILKIVVLGTVLTFSSCKKDYTPTPITAETEYLLGYWTWERSTHTYNDCDLSVNQVDVLTPQNTENTYAVEFLEEGVIKLYQNGALFSQKDIVFTSFFTIDSIDYFGLNPNNETGQYMSGRWDGTELFLWGFPYETNACNNFNNVYTK